MMVGQRPVKMPSGNIYKPCKCDVKLPSTATLAELGNSKDGTFTQATATQTRTGLQIMDGQLKFI
jgi:hypothetical protein